MSKRSEKLLLGSVPFVNAAPLTYLFGTEVIPDVALVTAAPSHLLPRLLAGELDAALIPVADFFRNDSLTMVDGLGIAADGAVESDNFHLYHPLRHAEAPKIEIALLDRPDKNPTGAGEPAIAPMPAAVANAVFAATGKRPRKLPINYDSLFGSAG